MFLNSYIKLSQNKLKKSSVSKETHIIPLIFLVYLQQHFQSKVNTDRYLPRFIYNEEKGGIFQKKLKS